MTAFTRPPRSQLPNTFYKIWRHHQHHHKDFTAATYTMFSVQVYHKATYPRCRARCVTTNGMVCLHRGNSSLVISPSLVVGTVVYCGSPNSTNQWWDPVNVGSPPGCAECVSVINAYFPPSLVGNYGLLWDRICGVTSWPGRCRPCCDIKAT